ncbi:hypothetical protein [Paenibacillus glacialis]|mgnify:CR=1 FL=1|uniref:hypothetical protein n=1 Tax=Paenibacillus glacialis TaxID=494026 RepID=UPI000AF00DB4|nr:hypothetical protein [Paenibacillus glacialis]
MKVTISQIEALEKGIWDDIIILFGLDKEAEFWPTEEFILTEQQAKQLGIIC